MFSYKDLFQGIEKKSARLKGNEKAVVARHEAGHAVVGTAVANLLTGQPRVEVKCKNFVYIYAHCLCCLVRANDSSFAHLCGVVRN